MTAADYYYNTVPRERTRAFLDAAETSGWDKAFYQLQVDRPREANAIFHGVLGFERAGWKFLLPLGPDKRALDIGCGWGAISLAFARSCGEVASLDMTRERLLSLRALSVLEGLRNMTFVHGGDTNLPFPDAHFDVVVMNGVLEWVPENRSGEPREAQVQMLREVARVLSPGGILYVAIENRLAARYLRRREDHVGLYWSSFLPRQLSDLYSRMARRRPYRTYTYSSIGYRRLFRDAGFGSTQLVCPLPHYRNPKRLANLESDPAWPADGGLSTISQHFAHSFSILASGPQRKTHGLHDVLTALKGHLSESSLRCDSYLVRRRAAMLYLAGSEGRHYLARLPYGRDEGEHARRNATFLRLLQGRAMSSGVETPTILFEGSIGRDYASVESRAPGVELSGFASKGKVESALPKVVDYLIAVGRESGTSPARVAELSSTFGSRIDDVSQLLLDNDLRREFEAATRLLAERLLSDPPAQTLSHGKLSTRNCFWDVNTNRLVAVVDWGHAEKEGLAGWDVASFLCDLRAPHDRRRYGRAVADFLRTGLTERESALWDRYYSSLGLLPARLPSILGTLWLKTVHERFSAGYHHLDRRWIEETVRPVLASLKIALKNGR